LTWFSHNCHDFNPIILIQGKFGQRSGLSSTEYFTNQDAYFDLVFDPSNEVQSIQIVNPKMLCVAYRKAEEFIEDAANTNVIIASWVTAQARLELESYLDKLNDRVLYMDTGQFLVTHMYGFPRFNFSKVFKVPTIPHN
jgi:hypothetical protein